MNETKFRVVITEPDSAFMKEMAGLIKKVRPDAEITECPDIDCSLLAFLEPPAVQYVLFDSSLLGENWRDRLDQIMQKVSSTGVVLMSQKEPPQKILQAFKLGIRGFVIKSAPLQTIENALNMIFSGEIYVPPAVFEKINPSDPSLYRLPNGKYLTPRQIQVLQYLGVGKSNKQIAYEMSVSEATVKLHINALLRHLKTSNRTQIVVKAQSLGFL